MNKKSKRIFQTARNTEERMPLFKSYWFVWNLDRHIYFLKIKFVFGCVLWANIIHFMVLEIHKLFSCLDQFVFCLASTIVFTFFQRNVWTLTLVFEIASLD